MKATMRVSTLAVMGCVLAAASGCATTRPVESARPLKNFFKVDQGLYRGGQPVFIHCQQGEDRTGAMVAIYRIARQGWTPKHAYAEALALGLADWSPFMRHVILHEAEGNGLQRSVQASSGGDWSR